jgi:hypothetical protein
MNQVIVYTLSFEGNLGCFPECMVVDTDDKGVFSSHYVKINSQNKSNFNHLFDETNQKLIALCLKLERDIIVSKTKDRYARTWEKLLEKYFSIGKQTSDIQYIKDYLMEYIETNQQAFFDQIANNPLYLPLGKFPFTWIKLSNEQEMPELLYCFDNQSDCINYSLEITFRNKQIKFLNGTLF